MKMVKIHNKEFKIIPEAKLIQGEMKEKTFWKDLQAGIKPQLKKLLAYAVSTDIPPYLVVEKTIHANAYCDQYDEWDEKNGIEVCSAKLELKNHTKLAKQFARAAEDLRKAADIAQEMCVKHEMKAMSIENDLVHHFGRLAI